jgi:cytochrome P450
MRPGIERAVDAILEEISPDQPCEIVSRFAEPLAVGSILEHLGIPREDFGRFRMWSLALMRARAEGAAVPGVVEAAAQAQAEMFEYLAEVAQQRENAGEASTDVLSVLIAASDEETIRPEEMMMMLIHISLAGNGPTAMALGNVVAALGGIPAVQKTLLEWPNLMTSAVEELLRFDSSTHFVARWARADTRIGMRTVRAGQQLHVMVGAANRDPERFPNPDAFQIERENNRHLSFGFGIHFCLGAPLARLEMEIALGRFLRHFGEFEVIDGQRAPNYQLHGFQRLQVRRRPNG